MIGRHHLATFIAAALAGLWGGTIAFSHWRGDISFLDRIEAPLADLRFLIQGQRPAPDTITIIAIDDETVQETGSYPLRRTTIAQLVDGIAKMGPKVIAIDLLFLDPGGVEEDRALASALGRTRSVLAAAGLFDRPFQTLSYDNGDALERVPVARNVFLPLKLLTEVAAVGIVNVATDPSGVPRHVPLLLRSNERFISSFPLRTASIAAGRDPLIESDKLELGDLSIPTDLGYFLPLRFYGPRGSIRTVSASEILKGQLQDRVIRDKIVVIGATVTGGGDVFPTPFDPVLPGVEVMATAIAHLTTGDGLIRDWRVRLADTIIAIVLPMLLVLLLSWSRSTIGFMLIAIVALLWIGLTAAAFLNGIWLNATFPLVAAAPPAILFGAARLWHDHKRAERLAAESHTLRHFQPPSLTERLVKDPNFLAEPVQQQAAVIFIDLSGFTGMSEMLGPDETRETLSSFHALIDEEAVRHHGIVAMFMGDGAMIIFGLPEPGPEDACHAVEACVALCSRTKMWIGSLPESIRSRLGFKIGAHFGTVIASRLGGGSHQHITPIGDTVNVASRLMEVAAYHHVEVALSDDLYRAAGEACSTFDTGALDGTFQTSIRGRSGSIAIWLWRSS